MSLIKSILQQLGLSTTPANNFTFDASADNGTMKLARGNAGATTQDIMTVDAAGKVAFPQLASTLATQGSHVLPNGLILKWGQGTSDASGNLTVTYPTAFPTGTLQSVACASTAARITTVSSFSASGVVIYTHNTSVVGVATDVRWIAIGY